MRKYLCDICEKKIIEDKHIIRISPDCSPLPDIENICKKCYSEIYEEIKDLDKLISRLRRRQMHRVIGKLRLKKLNKD